MRASMPVASSSRAMRAASIKALPKACPCWCSMRYPSSWASTVCLTPAASNMTFMARSAGPWSPAALAATGQRRPARARVTWRQNQRGLRSPCASPRSRATRRARRLNVRRREHGNILAPGIPYGEYGHRVVGKPPGIRAQPPAGRRLNVAINVHGAFALTVASVAE